jgi:hypothetical protein
MLFHEARRNDATPVLDRTLETLELMARAE